MLAISVVLWKWNARELLDRKWNRWIECGENFMNMKMIQPFEMWRLHNIMLIT